MSWNVCRLLHACLQSLRRAKNEVALETWVVDNGSSDGSVAMVAAEFPEVQLRVYADNPGFGVANNRAIAESNSDYVLLLNPDAELRPEALRRLCCYLDEHPDVAVVGPRLRNADGSVQSSRRRAPRFATGFVESTPLQHRLPSLWLTDRYYVADRSDATTQDVDWLVGACLLVRRSAIAAVGPLDTSFWMYSEELDWCLRFRRAGWRIVYLPEAEVIHRSGQSSGQNELKRHFNFHRSKYLLYSRLFGRPASLLMRLWIAALYAEQFGEELGKLALVARNRAMRRRRLSTLGRMLLWHLFSIAPGSP